MLLNRHFFKSQLLHAFPFTPPQWLKYKSRGGGTLIWFWAAVGGFRHLADCYVGGLHGVEAAPRSQTNFLNVKEVENANFVTELN